MFLTILLGFGGWIGLMGSAVYLWKCERPITHMNMMVAAAAPIVLPSTLVVVNCALQIVLLILKTILAAMVNEHLLIMFFSSVLVGASAGVGYNIGVHLVAEYKKTEVERLASEYEYAEGIVEEEDDANEEAGADSPCAPPWPSEQMPVEFMEPTPTSTLLRIKTPTQPLTELSTPNSEVMPKAPVARNTVEPVRVVKADLTGPETPVPAVPTEI